MERPLEILAAGKGDAVNDPIKGSTERALRVTKKSPASVLIA